jgi:arylsulfatase A-like enzyme
LQSDLAGFEGLDEASQHHYGELVAMDRSIGTLRAALRNMGIADNTLVWFCSDNGGLPRIQPETVGGLRGFKGSLWEGGLRVPAIIEWPNGVEPRVTEYPAATMDIFPTIVSLLDLPENVMLEPLDGKDLTPLFADEVGPRLKPIPFRYQRAGALVFDHYKLISTDIESAGFELYDLNADPTESNELSEELPVLKGLLEAYFVQWNQSVEASMAGKDYEERTLLRPDPAPVYWTQDERYRPFFEAFIKRPEYESRLKPVLDKTNPSAK